MAKRTLFSILAEQPWWLSLLVAAILFALVQLVLPQMAPFVTLPFLGIALYVGWKELRNKTPADAAEQLAALRAMPWEKFGPAVSAAYRQQNYAVEESPGGAFDFTLRKNGQITLVQCRRWKANQIGVGPVRELYDAMARNEAGSCVCLTAGEFSVNAREFATGKPISLLSGAALLELTRKTARTRRTWKIFPGT